MRRKSRKIALSRETLSSLEPQPPAGGSEPTLLHDCESHYCASGRWVECDYTVNPRECYTVDPCW